MAAAQTIVVQRMYWQTSRKFRENTNWTTTTA